MVSVPVRLLAVLFAFTEKPTVPLPLPLAPDVTCVHPWLLTAVQVQPEGAVTFTLPVPPLEPREAEEADSEYVQATPPSLTVKVWPPIVRWPVREEVPGLAVTAKLTVPFPVPADPAVTVSHEVESEDAVQPHPTDVMTLTDPPPATAPSDAELADSE